MKFDAYFHGFSQDYASEEVIIAFRTKSIDYEQLQELNNVLLDITAEKHSEKRSNDANKTLWWCIDKLARYEHKTHWNTYLKYVKAYGKATYVQCRESALETLQGMWRESEVIREFESNGQKAYELICYYGSSTYDTKEFANFLDSIIEDMKDAGLETPTPETVRLALEDYEKQYQKRMKEVER